MNDIFEQNHPMRMIKNLLHPIGQIELTILEPYELKN